jgi:hypothetical protein
MNIDGYLTADLEKEVQLGYKSLILQLFRILTNDRYCIKKECLCQPEYEIRHLLKNKELKLFLEEENFMNELIEVIKHTEDGD